MKIEQFLFLILITYISIVIGSYLKISNKCISKNNFQVLMLSFIMPPFLTSFYLRSSRRAVKNHKGEGYLKPIYYYLNNLVKCFTITPIVITMIGEEFFCTNKRRNRNNLRQINMRVSHKIKMGLNF